MPAICVAWIIDKCTLLSFLPPSRAHRILRCDYVQLDGTPRPNSSTPATWATAQKMRAALTFVFGKICGLGTTPWHESELKRGVWLGNPSASPVLSSFMTGLSREKASINMRGEAPTSSRAITADDLQRLHLLNTDPSLKTMPASDPRMRLGGWMVRIMLMALYTICFFCLLRGDEALGLQMQNIDFKKGRDGRQTLWIWLTHRKTNQHGGAS
ncbi:hypothetical protein CYLTODRAFT_353777 [Cylindrobasidium torrendii FP15055 ss-10]|uniref:Uncharacterized protein n=1 Tax=Cylindrobasidium torrendii FP15055 ss-10 TaxID=1314674 RepID=A0A0D7BAG8_9AGAR|nr:hypothetical protein CYLTODRAFT_353777 [Cylindrobasidium torrendii FP15055 ss-10]